MGSPHHDENRLAWNQATEAHNSHKGDQAQSFREGADTLFPEELELLGALDGLRLLHLQCNCGQDTLSLARRGAIATGVDISDSAIAFATRLSLESGIPAQFIRGDLYDWFEVATAAGQRFDRVFCSYGAIMWLSDLNRWARGIASVLAPGGRFVVVDFHPAALMFDAETWKRDRNYFGDGVPYSGSPGIGDYVLKRRAFFPDYASDEGIVDFKNPHDSHEYMWGLAQVVTALMDAGLRLEVLREYPFTNGDPMFDNMRVLPGGRLTLPEGEPTMPLMFGISACRPG